MILRSLKTNKLAVAKLRLGDQEKVERQRVEVQGAVENGNLRFGDNPARSIKKLRVRQKELQLPNDQFLKMVESTRRAEFKPNEGW